MKKTVSPLVTVIVILVLVVVVALVWNYLTNRPELGPDEEPVVNIGRPLSPAEAARAQVRGPQWAREAQEKARAADAAVSAERAKRVPAKPQPARPGAKGE